MEFKPFDKIPRLAKPMVITEKLDGTNASVYISEDGEVRAGSRNRWISVGDDNYGFARWVDQNKDELLKLGEGHHFGEWWGCGIQRNYHKSDREFSLFNTHRWIDPEVRPKCCNVVPVLYVGEFDTDMIGVVMKELEINGSYAAPSYMNPEGIIIYHTASQQLYKKTFELDGGKHGG